ncbi:hypothetical protein FN846DRAFT_912579 [Sphaerosporella brunnea]|uniref:Uncharacterized protein n=1 Tax=Sphaerosporella brunnea TaxID=1250544 RepID=A0A5J5EI71_9PEZI|nr:hypothetical protein FN846DRAFT_912579 [Sphaerosporella brunnea]
MRDDKFHQIFIAFTATQAKQPSPPPPTPLICEAGLTGAASALRRRSPRFTASLAATPIENPAVDAPSGDDATTTPGAHARFVQDNVFREATAARKPTILMPKLAEVVPSGDIERTTIRASPKHTSATGITAIPTAFNSRKTLASRFSQLRLE